MALNLKTFGNIFPHSKIFDQGLGGMRIGAGTFVVAQDGSGDFVDIQEAINAMPSSGGSIFVKEGIYTNFILNKSKIYIEGTGEATIIKGHKNGIDTLLICITANSCGISNLKLSIIANNWIGIQIQNNKTNVILNNIVMDGGDFGSTYGLFMDGSSMSRIIINQCIIENFGYGFYIGGSKNIINSCIANSCITAGMQTDGLTNSTISGNTFSNCTGRGLIVSDDNVPSKNNTISGNTASGNGTQGIEILGDCDNNILIGNTCTSNATGIKLTVTGIRVPDKNLVVGNICLSNSVANLTDGGTATELGHNIIV